MDRKKTKKVGWSITLECAVRLLSQFEKPVPEFVVFLRTYSE